MSCLFARSGNQVDTDFPVSAIRKTRSVFDYLFRAHAMKAVFLCVLALGFLQEDLAATSFVLVRVGNRLYIGSDGFRVNFGTGQIKPHCKITYLGDLVVLTWGLVQFGRVLPDGRIEFHSFSDYWMPIASTPGETIFQKRDRLYNDAKRLLKMQMEFLDETRQKPADARGMARFLVGAAFISMKDGIPKVGGFELRIRNWEKRELETVGFPGAPAWDWQLPHGFGHSEALGEIVRGARECGPHRFPERRDASCRDSSLRAQFQGAPAAFVERVLKLQSELTPHDVGPPYSIAVFSDSGLDWLENGACQASQKAEPTESFPIVGAAGFSFERQRDAK